MLDTQNEETLLEQAEDAENKCDWIKALTFYNQAAELYFNKGMIDETAQAYKSLGIASIEAAYTSDTAEELVQAKNEIIIHFEKAEMLFNQSQNIYGAMESKIGVLLTEMYFTTSLSEAKNNGEKALELLMQLYEFYDKQSDKEKISVILNYCAVATGTLLFTCNTFKEFNEYSQKRIDFAHRSWKISKEVGNIKFFCASLSHEYHSQIMQTQITAFRGDLDRKNKFKNILFEIEEALKIIENSNDFRSLTILNGIYGDINYFFGFHYIEDEKKQEEYFKKGLNHLEKSLEIARKIKDKGRIIDNLCRIDWWALFSGNLEYLQNRIADDISKLEKLRKEFSIFPGFIYSITRILTVYYATLARWSFFTPIQRKSFAKTGIEYAEAFLKQFPPGSKPPFSYIEAFEILVLLYSQLALFTDNKDSQDIYTQKMLNYADRTYDLGQQAEGGFFKAFGYLSKYNAYKTLGALAQNGKDKIKYLSDAIDAAKNHILHTIESRTGIITAQLRLGLLLEELGILSKDNEVLNDAKEMFFKVINEGVEKGYKAYAANAYQYAARIEDRLGNHITSAKNYEKANEIYEVSLKTINYEPLIKSIEEKMQYALAWNLIENAKVNHKSENHLKAKEYYLKACDILNVVPRYNFEAPYYMAWALLEEAEHSSKQEQQQNAIEIYEKTIKAFENAINNLEKADKLVKGERELVRINKLMKVAEIRINYCSARINLENARILGRQGEHTTAAELFAAAASKFRSVCTRFKLERERKELEAIYFLCRAWESMELAEKYEEHTRFAEAANLFTKASNLFSDTKLKFLASGNSAFCQALENGCKFDESIDPEVKTQLYPKVKVMLSKAASLYGKGGFESGADWAQATSMYFDAAWQLIKADEEIDLSAKGNLLKIGSEYLKSALELFGKAGYKEKEKEVRDRLYRVGKEETTLFSALSTIQEPSISRSTIGIVAPTCPIETSESPRLGEVREFSDELHQKEKEYTPTLLVGEEPIVLLILTAGGVPIFSYPFADEWKFDDELFGGFMSSFSSISDEIFSEGLDRAKFGPYTVLMESISDFSICYLFKGQIYLAKQKLTEFVERIQNNTSIWQTLNKFQKTSQVVELRDIPVMESLLSEIFLIKNP